ncbi:MAG: hypothetical protein IJ800_02410 [Clostridia bacterium]|nr:hypothetical protein [Clostridia bacterium]
MKRDNGSRVEDRFKKIVETDRVNVADQAKDLMTRAIALTLSEYFEGLSSPTITIDKIKDGMEITVKAFCSSVNAPSGIIK